jgi:hypothetical protein
MSPWKAVAALLTKGTLQKKAARTYWRKKGKRILLDIEVF